MFVWTSGFQNPLNTMMVLDDRDLLLILAFFTIVMYGKLSKKPCRQVLSISKRLLTKSLQQCQVI